MGIRGAERKESPEPYLAEEVEALNGGSVVQRQELELYLGERPSVVQSPNFLIFYFFSAAPLAYGSSQVRG